jgi:hypothetical protein
LSAPGIGESSAIVADLAEDMGDPDKVDSPGKLVMIA